MTTMNWRRAMGAAAVALCAAMGLGIAVPAEAQQTWWRDDIHRFHEHDLGVWRQGRWFHGDHGGRLGWWWIVGGIWYFYPVPIYPYPDPYVPPLAAAPVPQYYYWCSLPPGYYPQVPVCRVPWQAVPAMAPVAPPLAVAPPPDAAAPPANAVPAPPEPQPAPAQ